MTKANSDIRMAADQSGIKLWQIASRLGVTDTTLCKWMRKELPEDKKEQIFNVIRELKECEV